MNFVIFRMTTSFRQVLRFYPTTSLKYHLRRFQGSFTSKRCIRNVMWHDGRRKKSQKMEIDLLCIQFTIYTWQLMNCRKIRISSLMVHQLGNMGQFVHNIFVLSYWYHIEVSRSFISRVWHLGRTCAAKAENQKTQNSGFLCYGTPNYVTSWVICINLPIL